jgi:anti-sigma B factor antagonist
MFSPVLCDHHPAIVLRGDLDFFHKDALLAQLLPATAWERVTLDLNAVHLLDASALGCFIHLYNAMREFCPHSLIRLIGVRPQIARLFRLTRVDSLFDLVEFRKAA